MYSFDKKPLTYTDDINCLIAEIASEREQQYRIDELAKASRSAKVQALQLADQRTTEHHVQALQKQVQYLVEQRNADEGSERKGERL